LNILNCRISNYFFTKTGNVSASDGIDYCARRLLTAPLQHLLAGLKQFFSKTVCNVTGLGSIKKSYETHRHRTIHHFAKRQTSYNFCSRHSLPFCQFSV